MDYTKEVAKFAAVLEQKGFVTGLEGNISAIDRKTGLTYITPSRRMKLLLEPDMICVMDAEGNQIGGSLRRSSEYLLHEAAYKARPDAMAMIHCHCPYLTAYALRYQDFVVPDTCSLRELFTRFVCLPYGRPGTHEIHQGIEDALKDSPICLLGGHGVVCVSKTLEDCVGLLEAAEGLAKTLYLAKNI
ncbi:MAG: class II aldolase/adducin family protein [Clostridia bacterium]|nr:class II aldolase/adducin family protein [Clostridia bacterium]